MSRPFLFAVADAKMFQTDRPAGLETAEFIAPNPTTRRVFSLSELADLSRDDMVIDRAIVVSHPYGERDDHRVEHRVHHTNRLWVSSTVLCAECGVTRGVVTSERIVEAAQRMKEAGSKRETEVRKAESAVAKADQRRKHDER